MSTTHVVIYKTRAEAADENQRLVEDVFTELHADKPDGLRYATFRLADGVTFVHVVTEEGDDSALMRTKAFSEFQSGIADRCEGQPVPSAAELVGSYRFAEG